MIVKKNSKKVIKASEAPMAENFEPIIISEAPVDEFAVVEVSPAPDFCYVRDEIKNLVDYLAQFDDACAKETVGNLAYIYLDLTKCVESCCGGCE